MKVEKGYNFSVNWIKRNINIQEIFKLQASNSKIITILLSLISDYWNYCDVLVLSKLEVGFKMLQKYAFTTAVQSILVKLLNLK